MVPPVGVVVIDAVHVNTVEPAGVTVEFKAIAVVPALQIVCEDGEAEPTGTGFTVTSTVNDAPGQLAAVGITV